MLLFPFSDMFRTNYMGNIPGTRQRSESVVGGKDLKVFEKGGASRIPWKNWRPKMHVKVNEIKEIPVFKDIAGILNGYRQAGNENSKVKDPQISEFKRPGRTETKQRDAKRIVSLYESMANSGYFQTYAYDIISAKFSQKHHQHDVRKTEEFKKNYDERRSAIEENKRQYQQKPAQSNQAVVQKMLQSKTR